METARRYKVMDISPDEATWMTYMEDAINQQALDGWELVTAFQREHVAQQVGSGTVHLPSLVSTALIFRRIA